MRPLYLAESVRSGLGDTLRPGGESLTRRALEILKPEPEWRILDAGCGPGGTISCLQKLKFSCVSGVDIDWSLLNEFSGEGIDLVQSDLNDLPFDSESFDLVFCECVWNLTNRGRSAEELIRILEPGGYLALSDIYMQQETSVENEWPQQSCFSTAVGLEKIIDMVSLSGFKIVCVEDHSFLLKQAAAEFVFAHGSLHDFWLSVTNDKQCAGRICRASSNGRPGMFLLIAEKEVL